VRIFANPIDFSIGILTLLIMLPRIRVISQTCLNFPAAVHDRTLAGTHFLSLPLMVGGSVGLSGCLVTYQDSIPEKGHPSHCQPGFTSNCTLMCVALLPLSKTATFLFCSINRVKAAGHV